MLNSVEELYDHINTYNLCVKKDETFPALFSILGKLGYIHDVSGDKYSNYDTSNCCPPWEDIAYVIIEYGAMIYYFRDRFDIDNTSICFRDITLSENLKNKLIHQF